MCCCSSDRRRPPTPNGCHSRGSRPRRPWPGLDRQRPLPIATQRAEVFRRGYALVLFNPNDCAEDTTLRNARRELGISQHAFFPAYPGYDWGILAGWAWGASRVADYLEYDKSIDQAGSSSRGPRAMGNRR